MTGEEQVRRERLQRLKQQGVNPYPAEAARTCSISAFLHAFDARMKDSAQVSLAGRIRAIRKHGGLSFVRLQDESGESQIVLKRDDLGEEAYNAFHEMGDIGDFYSFTGTAFLTKKEEPSLNGSRYQLLTKSLLPLPEKWHGLTDTETRYRERYLDLIANPSVFANAKKRAMILKVMRDVLEEEGFIEVETPILQPIPGGATARPFITRHNTLHADFYLRIAPELYLKRLLVGGFEKVFEVARCFRNEGVSPQHNPEFTQIEAYWAYATIEDLMEHIERMIERIIATVFDGKRIVYGDHELNFTTPFPRASFHDLILRETGIDLNKVQTEEGIRGEMEALGVAHEGIIGYGELVDVLYKTKVRPTLIQPMFVTDYPAAMKPLAKKREDKFYSAGAQLLVAGTELMNAFNEQNDPLEQEAEFDEQEALRAAGSDEAQFIDKDYLNALQHGMPPAAGYGIGIDRLAAILTNSSSLKEIILFPTLKPKSTEGEDV